MLFIPPGTSNLVRAQGAFVSDDEINGIVDFLKAKNDPPVFAEAAQRQIDSSDEEGGGLFRWRRRGRDVEHGFRGFEVL